MGGPYSGFGDYPKKGGDLPGHSDYVLEVEVPTMLKIIPSPPSPRDDRAADERRKRIFDWPKRKKNDKD